MIIATSFSVAEADDSITIKYNPGYSVGVNWEASDLRVERHGSWSSDTELDRFFDGIRKTIRAAGPPAIWEPPRALHASWVTVEVTIDSKNYLLSAGYGSNGPEIFPSSDPSDQRHFRALRELIDLTTARMRNHLLHAGGQ
jgi:hypothetical protein